MASKKPKTILYRRRRENKTGYSRRLKLLLSNKNRLVLRLTNRKIIAQLIKFSAEGDKVLLAVESIALKKLGWPYSCKNIPAAYLTGLFFGRKALSKHYDEAILDTGFRTPAHQGKIYAFLNGALDSGFKMSCGDKNIFPLKDRLSGKHIQEYGKELLRNKTNKQQFAQYLKSGIGPEWMESLFDEVKKKINSGVLKNG